MNQHLLLTNADRIADIEREISGVKAQYHISQFELNVLETLKTQKFGSPKQDKVLEQIERKVFGYSRESELKYKTESAA